MAAVVSKTVESNTVSTYYVSAVAGPRIGKVLVKKGDTVTMTEHQARGLLATGALVTSADRVDDPWGEKAAASAAAAAKAAADAKAAEEAEAATKAKAAADAQAAAEKAAEDAKAAADEADAAAKAKAAEEGGAEATTATATN